MVPRSLVVVLLFAYSSHFSVAIMESRIREMSLSCRRHKEENKADAQCFFDPVKCTDMYGCSLIAMVRKGVDCSFRNDEKKFPWCGAGRADSLFVVDVARSVNISKIEPCDEGVAHCYRKEYVGIMFASSAKADSSKEIYYMCVPEAREMFTVYANDSADYISIQSSEFLQKETSKKIVPGIIDMPEERGVSVLWSQTVNQENELWCEFIMSTDPRENHIKNRKESPDFTKAKYVKIIKGISKRENDGEVTYFKLRKSTNANATDAAADKDREIEDKVLPGLDLSALVAGRFNATKFNVDDEAMSEEVKKKHWQPMYSSCVRVTSLCFICTGTDVHCQREEKLLECPMLAAITLHDKKLTVRISLNNRLNYNPYTRQSQNGWGAVALSKTKKFTSAVAFFCSISSKRLNGSIEIRLYTDTENHNYEPLSGRNRAIFDPMTKFGKIRAIRTRDRQLFCSIDIDMEFSYTGKNGKDVPVQYNRDEFFVNIAYGQMAGYTPRPPNCSSVSKQKFSKNIYKKSVKQRAPVNSGHFIYIIHALIIHAFYRKSRILL